MNARETMLNAVRAVRLSATDRPVADLPHIEEVLGGRRESSGDRVERFAAAARATAMDVVECTRADLAVWVHDRFRGARKVISTCDAVIGQNLEQRAPTTFADTDLFVCEAAFGVAENGAVWLTTARLGERAALFLATDVLVVLARHAIVEDLHEAYARIDLSSEAFGIFVAGPSKTADIEQSLVIGAHGPKGMTLALV